MNNNERAPAIAKADCFEDASDALAPDNGLEHVSLRDEQDAECSGTPDTERAELRVRLEETTEILRLALSNQFTKAIELCSDR
jgi:hypothetical protein